MNGPQMANKAEQSSTAILMPAFNEAGIIASVIEEIRQHCDFDIIVIDDASTDDTISCARNAGAEVLALAAQLGAWGATQTGLRYALRNGYKIAVSMDADGQHEASVLSDLVGPVEKGDTDISIGACTERGSRLRKFAWVLMKRASGLSVQDITSGYRVYNRKAIRALAGRRATFLDYQDIGVLLFLQSRGLKIIDIEVPMRSRSNGHSRVFHSWLMVVYYMCHTLLLGLSKRRLGASGQQSTSTR
jgi:glycosyltransferase involved in cell wall biosynthesis